jgi:hypothetical protein
MKAFMFLVLSAVARHLVAQEIQVHSRTATAPDPVAQTATQAAGISADKSTKEVLSPTEFRPGIGTIIVAELANSVSAKKAKIGDRVECTVVVDLLYQGKIVVPRNAKLVGRITEAEAFTKEHHESRLGLTFEKVVLKDKKELVFQAPAIVVALAPPFTGTLTTSTNLRDMPVQMSKGGQSPGASSTGSSVVNSLTANPNLLGGNMTARGSAIGAADRGVIGWPGVFLLKGPPGTSVIASPKNTVELGFQAQMVLRVVEPGR